MYEGDIGLDAIIIDTNAFDAKGNDFCGLFDAILPQFFETIKKLNLQLLSHPVLKRETIRHINTNDLKNKPEKAIKSLNRNKLYLDLIGFKTNEAIRLIKGLDLCKKTEKAFEMYYRESVRLPFAKPEIVFDRYFSNKPPFDTKRSDKKSEFPDAFVLGALEEYLEQNPKKKVMVVSNDDDWKSTLQNNYINVYLTDTIDSALIILNNYEDRIIEAFCVVYPEIEAYITHHTQEDVWFELNDYFCVDDIDVEKVQLEHYSGDIIPLSLKDNELILQVKLTLAVDGATTIIDCNNSAWDHEDNCYIFTSYSVMDFKHALGVVTAEINIKTDNNQIPILSNIKLIASHGVCLTIDEGKTHFTNINFETDTLAEQMDALEDYYNH